METGQNGNPGHSALQLAGLGSSPGAGPAAPHPSAAVAPNVTGPTPGSGIAT